MEIMSTTPKKIFNLSLDRFFHILTFSVKALRAPTFCIDFREI